MERTQRDVIIALLRRMLALGLISKDTCAGAEGLAYAGGDLPEVPRHRVKGADGFGSAQAPQSTPGYPPIRRSS